jgi:phosphate transport system protein
MSTILEEGLSDLDASLQREASVAVRCVRDVVAAFTTEDVDLAQDVIDRDDEVDEEYLRVEARVQMLLALQHPVAVDLRRVLAVLHASLHLERVADYCVTIAKLTRLGSERPVEPELVEAFEGMAVRTEQMVNAAVESLLDRDVAAAESLVELDDLVDRANREILHQVISLGIAASDPDWAMRILLVGRCVERMADHAVDIGEQAAFMVTGRFREFTDASHPELSPRRKDAETA